MEWSMSFFLSSFLLGVGLAMDAFSVSLANGLSEPCMTRQKHLAIAGTFALFQAIMPMLGWICVHHLVNSFKVLIPLVPWAALVVLVGIGGEMLHQGFREKEEDQKAACLGCGALLMQAVATSMDALSVGFAIAEYGTVMALTCSLIVAGVTFLICMCGVHLGRKMGSGLSGKAMILGGILLILVGIEIWLRGIL